MTQQTLNMIHQSYQEALEKSKNIIQIIENLYDILENAEVAAEDSKSYDVFIDGLRNCLRMRRMTPRITNIVTYISITIMYIIVWLNFTKQLDIDIYLYGRRKSLESHLTKLLRKSNTTNSSTINDLFALKGVIENKPEEQAIEYIYLIHDAIVGILAAKSRTRKDFINWVDTYVNPTDKAVLKQVLEIPFDVGELTYKDYISTPKPNGYQSLHDVIVVQPYSPVIPGIPLEIQLRTRDMDERADSGSASHQNYKKYLDEISDDTFEKDNPILKVFVVDDFSKFNIPGFTSYRSEKTDKDAIHYPKHFADRHMSDLLTDISF